MSTPAASTKPVVSTSPSTPNTSNNDNQNGAPGTPQEQQPSADTAPDGGYPEQKHAGAVGLGPEYGKTHAAEDPFKNAKDDSSEKKDTDASDKSPSTTAESHKEPANAPTTTVTEKSGAKAHPTEAGAREQAATTAPEGTKKAEEQRDGNESRQIDEGGRTA
ncbi:hypothetical protein EW026_g8201 [Hermanssonia centrifuga]|uniref:Uncharacterized protein n=1 Tax=Hermanssonia centrifuga TaxID=98765 RepID=A0A4S4K558_9APHY|nr:hypothetical protein EW026_g8201 [Hermanssonia centrifuga]